MTKNKVIKAGFGYTIGNYFLKGLSFITIPIFARLLSEQEYGYYNYFMTYVSICSIIIGLALGASFKNAKYKENFIYNEYISNSMTVVLLNSIIIALILMLLGARLGFSTSDAIILSLYSTSSALITMYNSYLGLEYRYKSYLVLAAFNAIINMLLSLFLVLGSYINNKGMARVIGGLIPELLIGIYIVLIIFIKCKPIIRENYIRFAFHFSIPLVAHGLSQIVLNSFDRIMI